MNTKFPVVAVLEQVESYSERHLSPKCEAAVERPDSLNRTSGKRCTRHAAVKYDGKLYCRFHAGVAAVSFLLENQEN